MSLIINDKKIAGLYKAHIIQNATSENSGIIRIATQDEVVAGIDSLTAVTPKHLATKQNVLIAGEGIEILEDGTINNTNISAEWGSIIGDISKQEDINTILLTKADVSQTAYQLEYLDDVLILKNMNGEELSSVRLASVPNTDMVTINYNSSGDLQVIGEITKNNIPKYTWIGTQEEYEQAKLNGIITELTEVLITDSEAEIVTPIVNYDAPTKLSDLANDMNFVTNNELQNVKISLEEKIDLQTDDTDIVHKNGNETIDGFKKFKQKIVIENGLNKGRIAHKSVGTSLEDGYIEFGDNTLLYGKQNINGELYDETHNIFHTGNLVSGDNISITKEGDVYKINSGSFNNANVDLSNLSIVGETKLNNLIVNKTNTDLSNLTQEGIKVIKDNSGGGLEIGDIGFTQMAIDETKGKRRILNGQLIIQEQYVQFTNIIKNSVALNPDLACTESEWQTEVTMNTFGLCGKFVIDDEGGTIRLPKYPNYFIAGLANIAPVVGNGMALGLTDGTNLLGLKSGSTDSPHKNALIGDINSYGINVGSSTTNSLGLSTVVNGITTDPTKSGIEAQIDKKQIAGSYFIQVATGAETEDNIINEIELNNPYSLFDSKYSEYKLNNLSWLCSEGQYNSKAIYPSAYDELLREYNSPDRLATFNRDVFEIVGSPTITEDGVASGFSCSNVLENQNFISCPVIQLGLANTWKVHHKFTTGVITRYNWIHCITYNYFYGGLSIGITTTKKLVVNLGSTESSVSNILRLNELIIKENTDYELEIEFTGTKYIVKYKEGKSDWQTYGEVSSTTKLYNNLTTNYIGVRDALSSSQEGFEGQIDLKQFSITVDGVKVFSGAKSKVKLSTEDYTDYDFVLNTAEETFRLPLLDGSEDIISGKYNDLTISQSHTTYIAPANGWVIFQKTSAVDGNYVRLDNLSNGASEISHVPAGGLCTAKIQVARNDSFDASYNAGATVVFRFIYAKGNGSLYFYVGETVQNANLINAGRIEEKLVNKVDKDSSWGFPSNKYIDLTLGASGTTYVAPANGYFQIYLTNGALSNHWVDIYLNDVQISNWWAQVQNNKFGLPLIPCPKGGKLTIAYGSDITGAHSFRFYYAEGEV